MQQEEEFVKTKTPVKKPVAQAPVEPQEPIMMKVSFEPAEIEILMKAIEDSEGFKIAKILGINTPVIGIYNAMYEWMVKYQGN